MTHFSKKITILVFNLSFLLILLPLSSENVKIRILQTTDVHSYIDHADNPQEGGWLRLATMIKKHRSEESCLLIDCGDTIQGSLSAIASRGEASIDLLNHLKYDFWVPGNHELDFGIPRLVELLDKTKVPILNGNFEITGEKPRKFPAWKIVEKEGAKICVIGMQASYLKHWFKGSLYEDYKVSKAFDIIKREMPAILKEKPHAIILALHQGFLFRELRGVNEIAEITRRFPEIDLILGGHTHQLHPGRNLSGVYYSQAAYHASHLGVVDLSINLQQRRVLKIESGLEKAGSEVKKDEATSQVYEKWRKKVESFSNDVLFKIKEPILSRGSPGKSSATSAVIAEAIRTAAVADFALHGRFTSKDIPRSVTAESLFKVIPYENNIYVLSVTRSQLEKIMIEQLRYLKSRSFNGPSGFKAKINKKTSSLKELILPFNKDVYTLAINSRVACGGGGRFLWLKKEIEEGRINAQEIKVNTRKALELYLAQMTEDFKVPLNIVND